MTTFKDLNLLSFGNTLQLAGAVFQGEGRTLAFVFPEDDCSDSVESVPMSLDDWNALLKQTDLLETEVLSKASDGTLAKVILRKSQRQIEQGVSWAVFKRDAYCCRYCGKDGVPLTVDHIICWEVGGPSIEANLISACRKCNKTRGNLPYAEWLQSPYYKKASLGLNSDALEANMALLGTLSSIPLNVHKRSR